VSQTNPQALNRWVLIAALAFVASALLLPWLGPGPVSLQRVLARQRPDFDIFVQLRVTRTVLALLAGGALSLAGCLFQALLREALATPYTLGISAGSSLGAVIVISCGWETILGIPAVWIGASAGAFVVLVAVLGGAVRRMQFSTFGLLLTRLATNSVCSALIILVHSFTDVARSFSITRWLIGSIDSTSYSSLSILFVAVTVTGTLVLLQARSWNLLAVGEQWAASRGAKVQRLLLTGYVSGSLLTAAAIALTGPIGFIGLIVPHLVRSRLTSDNRILMPCAFFFGGCLLAFCDALGRMVMKPAEVPTGVILALIGGPYLIYLVREQL
jgi:iron complex transport system permease protein